MYFSGAVTWDDSFQRGTVKASFPGSHMINNSYISQSSLSMLLLSM